MHLTKKSYPVFQVTFQAAFLVALVTAPVLSHADSWSCSRSNDVREIHIERSSSAPVPCDVVYKKLTEGVEDQVLWNANNDETYCDEKAKGLLETLESAGWVCTETISDAKDTEASETSSDQ